MRAGWLAVVSLVVVFAGCETSAPEPDPSTQPCIPGTQRQCICGGAWSGLMTCTAAGFYDACACPIPPGPPINRTPPTAGMPVTGPIAGAGILMSDSTAAAGTGVVLPMAGATSPLPPDPGFPQAGTQAFPQAGTQALPQAGTQAWPQAGVGTH